MKSGHRRRPDRRRGGADLAGQRLLHRAGRPAGGRHLVRQVQPRPTPASSGACPIRSRRTRRSTSRSCARWRSAATRWCRPPAARLVDADRGREHRRHPLRRAVPPEGRRAFLFENRDPDEAVVQAAGVGGARDRRQAARWTRRALRAARRDRAELREVDPEPARPAEAGIVVVKTSTCRTCSRPSRCRRRSTMRSRPARTATASRTKARPTPTT